MGYLEKSKVYKGYHYSVLDNSMIEYLHSKTLAMFKEVVKVLDANDIQYMVCGGTLLGAATTGKFIPWDDDVDMCVLEDDYDRMKKCLLASLPDWIDVQCNETEPHYYHGWLKVRDKNSVVYPNEPMYRQNGVWLDIYKLALADSKNVESLILQEHLDYLNRRYTTGCITKVEMGKRIEANDLINKLSNAKSKVSQSTDDSQVYIIWSASKILIDKEWCMPLSEVTFEEMNVTTFNMPEAYLVRHYGESFKSLPPEEKRRVGINRVEVINQIKVSV